MCCSRTKRRSRGMLTEALSPATQVVEKQSIVIDVMNGTTIPGYETLAAERLNYAGYETHIVPSDRMTTPTPS